MYKEKILSSSYISLEDQKPIHTLTCRHRLFGSNQPFMHRQDSSGTVNDIGSHKFAPGSLGPPGLPEQQLDAEWNSKVNSSEILHPGSSWRRIAHDFEAIQENGRSSWGVQPRRVAEIRRHRCTAATAIRRFTSAIPARVPHQKSTFRVRSNNKERRKEK
jgi:hypothetical protein